MVRTTTGPAEKSEPKKAGKESPAAQEKTPNAHDLNDATWAQVEAMARSQSTTTDEVIRRALVNTYGQAAPSGALHSGMKTDPSLQKES